MLSLVDEMQEMWASPQHKLTAYEAYLEERIALRCEDSTPDDSASTSSRLEAKYLSQLSTLEGSSPSRVGSKRGLDEDDEMSGLPELSAWARARAEQAAEQALEQESTAKRQRKQRATFWATAVVDTELLSRLTLQC